MNDFIKQRLDAIWSAPYMQTLPAEVRERGYGMNADLGHQCDILVVGFNPAYHEEEQGNQYYSYDNALQNNTDSYFSLMRNMLCDGNIDLRPLTAVSDLFYFRENKQELFRGQILDCLPFVVDQVNLKMHIIEDMVRPKLLIVKNKEAAPFFGKLYDEKGWVWMGYKFQHICNTACGELCKVAGLIDSNERIAPEFKQTNILGSYVLFAKHLQFLKPEERPTAQFLSDILATRNAELNLLKYAI